MLVLHEMIPIYTEMLKKNPDAVHISIPLEISLMSWFIHLPQYK